MSRPTTSGPEAIALTSDEARWLATYRAMDDAARRDMHLYVIDSAEAYPRHVAPRLRLVKAGAS